MQKVATLIIFEQQCRHHKAVLGKTNQRSDGKMSLLSAPGSVLIKTTLMKSLAEACGAPRPCSSKDNSPGR